MIHIPKDSREEFIPVNIPGNNLSEEWGIQLAGISDLTKGYRVDRRRCPFSLLICVLEGKGKCSINGEVSSLEGGDILVMEHETDHLYWCEGPWKILWFHLKKEQWEDSGESAWIRNRADLVSSLYRISLSYLRESQIDEGDGVLPSLGKVLNGMIRRMVSLAGPLNGRHRNRRLLSHLKKEIQRDLSRNWTVEELAERVNISPSYLYKISRSEEGTTPLGLVKKFKMDLAMQLLTHSDYPLQHIAERIGYSTAYAFTKAFKKVYDVSPGSYRRREPPFLRT